ncbi:MAG: LysR family transcriptional regulator [Lachnospiraceae bacterium]|nr:LysR family transcriptional regulator [Lachnospiraceae bacterium]
MNDRQLNSLLKAVECGSFSKAEEELFLSKQALKKQIDTLEDEVGFPLVSRNRQGITLTPAGEVFCKEARRILAELNAVIQRCKGIAFHEETIRIENPYHPRLMLEAAFDEFFRRFPTINQHIILQNSNYLVDDILNNRADVAECTYHSRFETDGIVCTKLFPSPYKCLMTSSNPLARRELLSLEDLRGQKVYMIPGNKTLISEINENFSDIEIHTDARNDTQEIQNICYNRGIFISRAYYIDFMHPLVSVPLKTESVPYAAILHRENPSQVVKEFLRVIQETYPGVENTLQ